jgi:hypothetical protein
LSDDVGTSLYDVKAPPLLRVDVLLIFHVRAFAASLSLTAVVDEVDSVSVV